MTDLPPTLLPYQQRWVDDRSATKVGEKSRRVGFTWATAFEATETAALSANEGGADFWYQVYSEDDAKEFIRDCEKWARALQIVCSPPQTEWIDDTPDSPVLEAGEQSIQVFSISFASGFRIRSLAHTPKKLRGKGGVYCLDEAAYHDDLQGAIEASRAFRVWGGRTMFISTVGYEDDRFDELVKEIRRGERDWSLHSVTLHDAVAEGLYRKICENTGTRWTQAGEEAWVAELLSEDGADAEYRCIPRKRGGSRVFHPREWCEFVDAPPPEKLVARSVRGWDRAATKPHKNNRDPDWTRGVKLQWTHDGTLWIVDGIGLRDSPGAVTDAILAAARADGIATTIALWQDPGAAGKYEAEDMHRRLIGFDARFEVAREAKQTYWNPVASAMRPLPGATQGKVKIVRGPWVDNFCTELSRVPNASHDDWADALAGAFLVGNSMPTSTRIHVPPRRHEIRL